MDVEQFAARIIETIPHEATRQQATLAGALARYCSKSTPSDTVFLLSGYAGTGKTTIVGALVKVLPLIGMRVVLLAPTGRAAKVLSAHAGLSASTIHRRIYKHGSIITGNQGITGLAENKSRNTLFIVDEASMISSNDDREGGNLLEDLIHYVFSGINCRLILSGDTAQLPPPGDSLSPAMNPDVLKSMGLGVRRAVMTATVRQASHSGILYNATKLRSDMGHDPIPEPALYISPFKDVDVLESEDLVDALDSAYAHDGPGETLLVTRSNMRAVRFNLAIRSQILDYESMLVPGERIMIARNNYYWSGENKAIDFIANGDMAVVEKIYGTESRDGLLYADVSLRLTDRDVTFDTKLLLSALTSEAPALDPDLQRLHFESCINDRERYTSDVPYELRLIGLRTDPYYQALQVKYAYAVTCHKAQGGQWKNVFVDMGMIQPQALTSLEFYRWLYTAITRATGHLTFVGSSLSVK